jgi:hypothetical protein
MFGFAHLAIERDAADPRNGHTFVHDNTSIADRALKPLRLSHVS